MHNILLASIVSSAFALLMNSAGAKDCDCEKHRAGASGTGSCSLTEDVNRCSIAYTATGASSEGGAGSESKSGKDSASSTGERNRAVASRLASEFKTEIPLVLTFQTLNQRPPKYVTLAEFRSLVINSFSLAGGGEALQSWIKTIRIGDPKEAENSNFKALYSNFVQDGCVEFVHEKTRFLLMTTFSQFNGRCKK